MKQTELKHFKPREVEGLTAKMKRLLDTMRENSGFPYYITSGHRPNDKKSSHSTGIAVDIRAKGGKLYELVKALRKTMTPAQVFKTIQVVLKTDVFKNDRQAIIIREGMKLGVKRFGIYDKHVHLDLAIDRPYPTIWDGKSE